ncbi:MAG TPA: magnesium transporter [Dehalococcoidia bacterium]|nr:magnesium transporter [Dehalococcoidia bacterium]
MVNQEQIENLRETLADLIQRGELAEAVSLLTTERHPADQADLIEHLDDENRDLLIPALSSAQLAAVLEDLSPELRSDLLSELPARRLAPTLDQVDEDVVADILQDLEQEQRDQVVQLLTERESVEELLQYPEDTAGGRMSTDFVALRRDWTVDQAIRFLRNQHPDIDTPFYVYVVDDEERLTGLVNLRSLVTAAPETPIAAIMSEDVISVRTNDDQEAAAERMRHYNLMALPVLDEAGGLRGVFTADNVLDVQVEEATEDIYRMAGIGVKEWAFSPVWESAGRRVPWLAFNMVWAFAGAVIISVFQGTIDKVAALAIFMPMIAGQAGNAGIQTATIVVRSMALGELQVKDGLRVLRKEWILGLIKGVIFGGVLAVVAWVWEDHAMFGLVAGAAMFLNMIVASTTGVIIPITLRRLGIDPATIAGVFDTMITDFMGFLIYLGLATLLVSKLT